MMKLLLMGLIAFQCSGAEASRIHKDLSFEAEDLQNSTSTRTREPDRRRDAPPAERLDDARPDKLPPNGTCRNPKHVKYQETYAKSYNSTLQQEFWGRRNVEEAEMQRYQVLNIVGAGREGAVAIAMDSITLELVAIKKVLRLFRDRLFTQSVRNEIKVMDLLKESPDVMKLRRIVQPYNWATFDSVFMVIEMMEMEMPRGTLHHSLDFEPYIDGERMRRNVFQVLRGLHYLHTAGLVYNDMRYHNVMLDKHCNTRIIDMGMVTPGKSQTSMRHDGTMHLPGSDDHEESPRDIWMLGSSILVWVGGPDFHMAVGKDTEKAEKIVNIVGLPESETLSKYSKDTQKHLLAAHAKQTKPTMSLAEQLPDVDPGLLKVVEKMVGLNSYANRPSARQLLNDPYFEGLEQELGPIEDGPRNGAAKLQRAPAFSTKQSRGLISLDLKRAGTESASEREAQEKRRQAEEKQRQAEEKRRQAEREAEHKRRQAELKQRIAAGQALRAADLADNVQTVKVLLPRLPSR